MTLKKKYISLFLIFAIITLSFCACNDKKTDEKLSDNTQKTQTVTQETKIEEEDETEYRLSFVGCGDNIIYGTKEARIFAEGTDRKYNYKPYYSGVSDIIEKADISFINQETVMCGEGYSLSYYPMFNSPQEVGLDLCELGFNVVNIANNHMLDKGSEGLEKTIEFWKSQDVLMIGGYESAEDFDNIRILEKDGIKIAFLSYTYATNGLTASAKSNVIIPYINDDDIVRQTKLAKESADLVFVSVHWGDEGSFVPNDDQEHTAKLFADSGVDVIIGHHPHVIQPLEWIDGVDGNKTLCVYSLGNFMAQQDRAYNMVGGIISFDIVYSEKKLPYIDNVKFLPTVFHFNGSFTDNNVYLFENYSPEMTALHGVRTYYGNKFTYELILSYITDTIDEEFLPDFFKENGEGEKENLSENINENETGEAILWREKAVS